MYDSYLNRPPAALLQVATDYGTPTYVYDAAIITRQINALKSRLSGVPMHLHYAMKANPNPHILRLMLQQGLGIDAVSPGELILALRVGFPPERILYSANNMTDDEMDTVYQQGVLLNLGELSRLEKFGQRYPGSDVCVRLNPQIGAGHHEHVITAGEKSKFGIPVGELSLVEDLLKRYRLHLKGLHQHIGSGILNTEVLWQAICVILDAGLRFPDLAFLNFGGGLGVAYHPDDEPLDLENIRKVIVAPLQRYHQQHPARDLTFSFEPGRYLVAESGMLLTRANTLKKANGRWFAGTDSGMGHLMRPAFYSAYHPVYNLSNPGGPLATYDVVGNICESSDFFARSRAIQQIREGDVLAILNTGAYGMAMASTYNLRPLPAEVFIDTAGTPHLARPRLTDEALADQMLYPYSPD